MVVDTAPLVKQARIVAFIVPLVALGGALISQYVYGLYPCEMCWWQRYPHGLALVLAAIAFFWRPVRPLIAVAALAILGSGLIGGFHAGVEYGWWQGVTACTANATANSSDPLAAIMSAPVIRCDVAPWSVFNVSLAGWNFLFSTLGALIIFGLIARSGKAN